MPEMMSVVKTFIFATVLMIGLQVKVGSASMETHMVRWIHTSSISTWVQGVASGAVLAIRNGSKTVTGFVSETFGHDSALQKAGRLNFEFKRSQRYEEEQAEKN